MNIKNVFVSLSIVGLIFSCSDDDAPTAIVPSTSYEDGILITHEGQFSGGFGTVSYVSNDFTTVENNIFSNVNNRTLGTVAQSMAINGDLAYIVINVSNQIEVVNKNTFESVATINTGLSNPRFMTISNGKGYVTNWGDFTPADDDYVAVIDLATNAVVSTISCSYLPEELIEINNKVYVATGVFDSGNKVDVINTTTDTLEQTITVGNSPNSLQLDSDGDLWVLSSENLVEIDTTTDLILQTIDFGGAFAFPSDLNFDNGSFYIYDSGSVFKMDEASNIIPTTPEFTNVNFYDMRVRNGLLYGLDARDFASNGTLQVYDLTSNTEIQTFTLGVIPGGVYFND